MLRRVIRIFEGLVLNGTKTSCRRPELSLNRTCRARLSIDEGSDLLGERNSFAIACLRRVVECSAYSRDRSRFDDVGKHKIQRRLKITHIGFVHREHRTFLITAPRG